MYTLASTNVQLAFDSYAKIETNLSIGSGCADTEILYNCDRNFLKASKNGQCDNTQIHLFV